MRKDTVVIERRFHGPRNSSNGGYACGRLAEFIDGPARVRLRIPPPLEVELEVRQTENGVILLNDEEIVAECWPEKVEIDIPDSPSAEQAEAASRSYRGFESDRFSSCFVCGKKRETGEGLRVFAGPVPGREMVACVWTPDAALGGEGRRMSPVFVWAALDCPGAYTFREPSRGTILLGELTLERFLPVVVGRRYIVTGWEIAREGRKHHTGTALFSESGTCHAVGKAIWFVVEEFDDD